MRIYPAIDVAGGRCVRLEQGRFDRATVYGDDPLATAATFAREGAEALHLVDLDGARDPRARQVSLVEAIAAETPLRVQVGGGIRSEAEVASLLAAGAARVVVGSLVVREPDTAAALLARFGAERLVFALDVRVDAGGRPLVTSSGWRETGRLSLWDELDRWIPRGLACVLCTDVSRDGMLSGPNLELYRRARRYPGLELLASGGIASLGDVRALRDAGASGAVIGKALYERRFTLTEALAC